MTSSPAQRDRLYTLLPAIQRMRDAAQGEPLRALLQVIAEQVDVVEADIAQLYENWFIETCEDWVVPYIADLIGYRPVAEAGLPAAGADPSDLRRGAVLLPRREVANTIAYRRRKGTLALLELLAGDVAGWPARAVEFYTLLARAQPLARPTPARGRSVSLRDMAALARLDGPFDTCAHSVDLRPIGSRRGQGRYHVPNVGLFVWRLKPYPVTRAPAFCLDRVKNRYTFSLLGNNTPLVTRPIGEPAPTHIADELNLPADISRRAMAERLADYYGQGKSLQIWRDSPEQAVPIGDVVVADLSDWGYQPAESQVAVDPLLGRIAFPERTQPRSGVWVSYHYAFSADVGAGEYRRSLRPTDGFALAEDRPTQPDAGGQATRWLFRVGAGGEFSGINRALGRWQELGPADAVIEIQDSGEYSEQINVALGPGQRLELRAADQCRPTIRLLDFAVNRPDAMRFEGRPGEQPLPALPPLRPCDDQTPAPPGPARLTLDGLLVMGRSVQISGEVGEVVIRHCTLLPGWSLGPQCEPQHENEPSLELANLRGPVRIERSIVGTILALQDEVKGDPLPLFVSDSVIDATRPGLLALGARGRAAAHVALDIRRSSVVGRAQPHAIELAENCIFDGELRVARTQRGCVRFCYAPPGSRTPRRYSCQPELAAREATERAEADLRADEGFAALEPAAQAAALAAARAAAEDAALARVRPQFTSRRFGQPGYMQLGRHCPPEIARGADDESELGVFHDLYQPQRAANLLARLSEYAPAGMEAGIIVVS